MLKHIPNEIDPNELPEEMVKGLDLAHQWYLYEQIHPHKSTLAADFTCKPTEPNPTTSTPEPQVVCETSSVCHTPGHTERTCSQK